MNPSQNSPIDFSKFGGTKIEEDENDSQIQNYQQSHTPEAQQLQQFSQPQPEENKVDYSQFGGKQVKEKAGKVKSIFYGLAEGALGIPALIQHGVNEWSKGLEKAFGVEIPELTQEEENPISSYLSTFPESEDEGSRRLRTGTAGVIAGAPFGIPGIIAGLVGSQAGQTVREIYGNEGKFDEFGLGEGVAIGADILSGGVAGAATSLARGGARAATQTANQIPAIFRNGETGLTRAIAKNTIQGEKQALKNVINGFSESQLRGFEQQASAISPNRYTELLQSSASGLKQHADNMFRNTQLNLISPLATTPEQGGRALQEAANSTFQTNVLAAERGAYNQAREAAKGIAGTAPKTVEQAKALRTDLLKNPPTPEQQPLIGFLNDLISSLETTTPASTSPASSLVGVNGRPLIEAVERAATQEPTKRAANDLVDLVQRSNQAVNYGGELRQQSHRLAPLVNTLRQEVATVLNKKPAAAQLYQAANLLHGRNAEIWGTKFMRNLRFGENPERIVGQTKLASNMRNLKQGIDNPTLQGVAERLAIEDITRGGSLSSNRTAINNLSPELSLNARNASQELINVKDPLTTTGGRAAVRNDILKDAAMSVSTGKRPDKILDLMQTPKGYQIVRESLNGSPQSRELFSSIERLFVEDIFSAITDKTGSIDFSKARNIIKNQDVRNVLENIGGPNIIRRFNQLEGFASNFERNMNLYKTPEAQSLFKKVISETKNAGLIGAVLHSLHMPIEIIAGLGVLKGVGSLSKLSYNALSESILSNPRAVRILERISTANTTEELAKQLPRLIAEIEEKSETE